MLRNEASHITYNEILLRLPADQNDRCKVSLLHGRRHNHKAHNDRHKEHWIISLSAL